MLNRIVPLLLLAFFVAGCAAQGGMKRGPMSTTLGGRSTGTPAGSSDAPSLPAGWQK